MSSRASTEVATGAEARSVRRWLRRAVAPTIVHYVVLLALLALAGLAYGEVLATPSSYGFGDVIDSILGEDEAPRIDYEYFPDRVD